MALSVEHTDLGTAVTASLRAAIVCGDLPAGGRLVETDLASQFGVSRGPIRDALAELQRSGLVELRARKGSFVRTLSVDDVEEVYSLRLALESLAVRRAVANGVDHRPLQTLLMAIDEAHDLGDNFAVADADMALHRGVVTAAGHVRLLKAWERLADQTLLMMTALSSVDSGIQGPAGNHSTIVEQIAAGDADAAVAALTEHLDSARAVIAKRFRT